MGRAACRRRLRRTLAAVATGALLALVGCGAPEGGDERAEAPAALVPEGETRRLRALGYLGYARKQAEGESFVTVWEPGCSCSGYDLLTYPALARAELVSTTGRTVRTWSGPGLRWERATFAPDGDLLVVGVEEVGTDPEGRPFRQRVLLRLGFEGDLLWKRVQPVHHHVATRRDGRLAALTSRRRTLRELFGEETVVDNGLAILSPGGERIEAERSLSEMLGGRPELFRFRDTTLLAVGGESDVVHSNYFEWMPGGALAERDSLYSAEHVLVTLRQQDTVAVFDFAEGELVWAWGRGELVGPHDAQVLESGNLLVFDNRGRTLDPAAGEGWSRVVELDPLRERIVWEYRADPPGSFYSVARGTVQRLANGNTLIGSSNQGRVFEVTPAGEVVWEYRTPHRNAAGHRAVLRAERYPAAFVEPLLGPPRAGSDPPAEGAPAS